VPREGPSGTAVSSGDTVGSARLCGTRRKLSAGKEVQAVLYTMHCHRRVRLEIVGSVFERWRVAEPDPRRIILAKWHQRERLRVYQKRNSDGLKTEESAESTARSSAAALAEVLVQYASH
jgi:hypothetical protein